jgi:hypothetical protein
MTDALATRRHPLAPTVEVLAAIEFQNAGNAMLSIFAGIGMPDPVNDRHFVKVLRADARQTSNIDAELTAVLILGSLRSN